MVLLTACLPYRKVDYMRGGNATRADTLYRVKVNETLLPSAPIFSRSEPSLLDQGVQVAAVDLRTSGNPRVVKAGRIMMDPETEAAPLATAGLRAWIEVDDAGQVTLWGPRALKARLLPALGPASLDEEWRDPWLAPVPDEQDARILYLYSKARKTAYRFEPPYTRCVELRLADLLGAYPYDPRFHSVLGEDRVFVGTDAGLHELAWPSGQALRTLPPLRRPRLAHAGGPVRVLIALTRRLRIYQTYDAATKAGRIVVETEGGPERSYDLPPELAAWDCDGEFLARSGLVLWSRSRWPHEVFYSLELDTGVFRRADVSMK